MHVCIRTYVYMCNILAVKTRPMQMLAPPPLPVSPNASENATMLHTLTDMTHIRDMRPSASASENASAAMMHKLTFLPPIFQSRPTASLVGQSLYRFESPCASLDTLYMQGSLLEPIFNLKIQVKEKISEVETFSKVEVPWCDVMPFRKILRH